MDKVMGPDREHLERLRPVIGAVAESFGLDAAVVAGVISRESGGGRLLGKWGNPPGTGDRGHGRGLMQIDDRYWRGALNLDGRGGEEDAWRWPAFNVAFGCWLLRKNLDAVRKQFPKLGDEPALRGALAAYNCGLGRVLRTLDAGRDVDSGTTGRDYSRDVLRRAEWLREHGWKESKDE